MESRPRQIPSIIAEEDSDDEHLGSSRDIINENSLSGIRVGGKAGYHVVHFDDGSQRQGYEVDPSSATDNATNGINDHSGHNGDSNEIGNHHGKAEDDDPNQHNREQHQNSQQEKHQETHQETQQQQPQEQQQPQQQQQDSMQSQQHPNGHDAEEDAIPGPSNAELSKRQSDVDLSISQGMDKSDRYVRGKGVLASRKDLNMPPDEFADGCILLQQAAKGDQAAMEQLLAKRPGHANFRDYDRRTALHVAASEGHLDICKYLIENGASINRSDRWGGSPLDDAHRHLHSAVVAFLRDQGATTGSSNQNTNLITAAAEGDTGEVAILIQMGQVSLDEGDYDKRTALHLAAGEGHDDIVDIILKAGADVNAMDRWGNRPLDDAEQSKNQACITLIKQNGGVRGLKKKNSLDSSSMRREMANLEVDFAEIDMIEKIGAGAFGEIYKCNWRGTQVAAKCIRSAKIRKEWNKKQFMNRLAGGEDVDDVLAEADETPISPEDKQLAMEDFRTEISLLKSLRHPHIVLLLAYSTLDDNQVLISELMKCSLLDVFKANRIHKKKLNTRDAITYATHLSRGMLYLHTCRPPIIHRDLKPANLLIDQSGILKVADFGLSKARPDPKQSEKDQFTMTGETGSYRFMAPEVFRHENYTETVDIYSFAMIFFYMLDGNPPWPNENGVAAVRMAALDGDRPILPRNWDARFQTLLQECWDENPKTRPPFKKILSVLNDYARDMPKTTMHRTLSTMSVSKDTGCSCAVM